MDKLLKECFARLTEEGELDTVTNKNLDEYVHIVIYLLGEILPYNTDEHTLQKIKEEVKSYPAILNSGVEHLENAIKNVYDNITLKKILTQTKKAKSIILSILDLPNINVDTIEMALNSKLKTIKESLAKILQDIKEAGYEKSEYWTEKIKNYLQTVEKYILVIDDERNIKATKTARTFEEGMRAIKERGWDKLYIDHDLGDPDPRKTGYDILNWLEANPSYTPKEIISVTSNPVGKEKMEKLIKRLTLE